MTTGFTDNIVVAQSPWYTLYPGEALTYQGLATIRNGTQRIWEGANRIVTVKPKRLRERRHYYTLRTRTFVNKRGKLVTKTYRIRRSYTVLVSPRLPKSSSAPNAYSAQITRYKMSTVNGVNPTNDRRLIGISPFEFGAVPTFADPSFTPNDDIRLINKLSELIRGSDFNAAVFLGEGGKALEMIGNAAIKMAAGLRHVKRGNLASAVQAFTGRKSAVQGRTPRRGYTDSKSIEKTWLESSYGWQPLLKDIHGGAEMLSHIVNSHYLKRYQARLKKSMPGVPSDRNDSATNVASKQIVAYITKPESLANQLGLLNPELVAWELLPFSFVFDWFLPVGAYLQARAFSTSDLKGTFVTTTTQRVKVRGFKSYYGTVFEPSVFEYDYINVKRTVSSVLEVPMPVFVPLNKILSWKRAANAVALISVLRPRG